MSDHHAGSKEDGNTSFNTPAGTGEESDTPRPNPPALLPTVNVIQSSPPQVQFAPANDNTTIPHPRSPSYPDLRPSNPLSPGNAPLAGPSTASSFSQQPIATTTSNTETSPRHHQRKSLVPSTLQESPTEEEGQGSASNLLPKQAEEPPAPPPPNTKPQVLRDPSYGTDRPLSMPGPVFMEPQYDRRHRSMRSMYDMSHDRQGSLGGRRVTLSPRQSYTDGRPGDGNGNGVGMISGDQIERNAPYPYRNSLLAEEGRVSRRTIIDHAVPTEHEILQMTKEKPEERYKPNTVGARLEPTLKHAQEALLEARRTAKATGWGLNVAIGAQVILGALTTGVAAATTGRQTSIATTILGGLSTLAASYLAKARGSGQPENSITKCNDLEHFVRSCEAFLLDYGDDEGHTQDRHIARYRMRFEELQGNDSSIIAEGIVEKGQPNSTENLNEKRQNGRAT
ncbi:unnamed protein product [Somion occarium]|uniref:SMODS and SLOG-associating 2TM effector domain-containing protein n=1 Tax=Somion occarium TaxID=3059160 RepID=A0ABP1D8D7_9APHY